MIKIDTHSLLQNDMNTRTQKIILIISITLVGGGLVAAMLKNKTSSPYRATETITPPASAPALPPSELKQSPAPVILNDSEESPANAGSRAREILPSAQDDKTINKEWRLYQNAPYNFTIEYPPTWSVTEADKQIYFRPLAPALYEVERDPRIALTIKSRADVLGVRTGEETWFDTEVVANAERYDAVKTAINGVTHYRFSEGAGEYPHRQTVIFRNERVYWFEVQASDAEIHDVFSKLTATIRF